MSDRPKPANPFVGPRPFERGERLYGREAEIRELQYFWKAERIVLLHSPSGAGKSSLLQAGLLPRVDGSFDVWGPTRVHQELPAGIEPETANRYAISAMLGFEDQVPTAWRRSTAELAALDLTEFVATRRRQRKKAARPVALVFDQFEEILTTDPLATDAKREFFDQLGHLLRDPRIWALFVIREDFLAPLDPYAAMVPTHLENRFRIDLLGLDGAREAVVQPALDGARTFPAADRLIQDLATLKVQQADGSFAEQVGVHVEPVQLQVVCYRLWEAMPADDLSIEEEDVAQFGDVSESLSDYYSDSVRRIAGGAIDRERAIRDWFGERLIRAGDVRGQVLRGVEASDGLDHKTVEALLDTHLVRAESRAGATWYELAHDRLIAPVRSDNARWRAENLSEVQERAALWEQQGRPPELLLRDRALVGAEEWLRGSEIATAGEIRFLEASQQAQAVLNRERRQTHRIRLLGVVAMVIAAVALVACIFAVFQMLGAIKARAVAEDQRKVAIQAKEKALEQEQIAINAKEDAEEQKRRALAEKRAADVAKRKAEEQAQIAREQERRAVENEREAERRRVEAEAAQQKAELAEEMAAQALQDLRESQKQEEAERAEKNRLERLTEARTLAIETRGMTQADSADLSALLALEAYRMHLDAGGEPDEPHIYDALRLAVERLKPSNSRRILGHEGAVRALAVAPSGGRLATGGEDGAVRWVDMSSLSEEPRLLRGTSSAGVRALAWSPDGGWLSASGADGSLRVWSAERLGEAPRTLRASGPLIHTLTFASKTELVIGECTGAVSIWDLEAGGTAIPEVLQPGVGEEVCDPLDGPAPPAVRSLAVHGASLAAASDQRGVLFWGDLRASEPPHSFATDTSARSVAIGPGGQILAAGTVDGLVLTWDLAAPSTEPTKRTGHTARVEALAFHPSNDRILVSASLDGTLRLWDVKSPEALPLVLEGHEGWVWTAVFSPDGGKLFSGGADRAVRLWTTSSEALAEEVCRVVGTRALEPAQWSEFLGDEPYRVTCGEEVNR